MGVTEHSKILNDAWPEKAVIKTNGTVKCDTVFKVRDFQYSVFTIADLSPGLLNGLPQYCRNSVVEHSLLDSDVNEFAELQSSNDVGPTYLERMEIFISLLYREGFRTKTPPFRGG